MVKGTSLFGDKVELPPEEEDDLAPARGIIGAVLGTALIVAVGAVLLWTFNII